MPNKARNSSMARAVVPVAIAPQGDLAHISAKNPPINLQPQFLYPVGVPFVTTITLPPGTVVTGHLVHLDAFSVSVVGSDGWYRSWPVSKVKVNVKDPLAKHHELIDQYSNADLHNVFAYLESLK